MPLHTQIQKVGGRLLRVTHKVAGHKVTYTLVTDRTTNPMTTTSLDIYVLPVAEKRQREDQGGRRRMTQGTGDVVEISRESLKVAGVYYDPTEFDSWVDYGETTPVWRVKEWESIGDEKPGWRLHSRVVFNTGAKG